MDKPQVVSSGSIFTLKGTGDLRNAYGLLALLGMVAVLLALFGAQPAFASQRLGAVDAQQEVASDDVVSLAPQAVSYAETLAEADPLMLMTAFVPRTTRPGADNANYYSRVNPYYCYNWLAPTGVAMDDGLYVVGNCTWYAWGRAREILGSNPQIGTGSPYGMWDYVTSYGTYEVGSEPRVGALCIGTSNTGDGHVSVVEEIIGGVPYVSESGYSESWDCPTAETVRFHYGPATYWMSGGIIGYVYLLDNPEPIEYDTRDGFKDVVKGEWYVDWIHDSVQLKLFSGYAGGEYFGPDDELSRGMVVTLLYRAYTGNTVNTTNNEVNAPFSDVASGEWYSAAVSWAAEHGITTGYAETDLFGPDDPVTREQLATFIGRYAAFVASGGSSIELVDVDMSRLSSMPDAEDVDDFARTGMAWCMNEAIISGKGEADGEKYLDPQAFATRAEMAKIITVTVRDVLHQR